MRTAIYLILGVLFVGIGIAVWVGVLFPALPEAGYLRLMIGLVLVLMGVHRCGLAFYPGPRSRHPGPRNRQWHRPGSDHLQH